MKLAILALLIFGMTACATTATAPVNPFTTPEIESNRLKCLSAGWMWMESQTQFGCMPPDAFQRERT